MRQLEARGASAASPGPGAVSWPLPRVPDHIVPHQFDPLPSPAAFDPLAAFFAAQASRPVWLEGVVPNQLSPLQRGLLVVDGTVTTFLEAWALEPIRVTRLWQKASRLDGADPWLKAAAGDGVVDRAVLLTGARSRRCFAFAESRILVERLPETMRRDLEVDTAGLGQILLRSPLDSRRDGLWYGRERGRPVPSQVAALAGSDFLVRTYRVSAGGQPLMLITERFPFTDDGGPATPSAP